MSAPAEPLPSTGPDLDHHGDLEVSPDLVDFAVNVHRSGPPDWLAAALREAVAGLGRYPDPAPARSALAALHGVPRECVLVTAGAAEAFTLLASLPFGRPVVVHPQFTEPEAALRAHGHDVDRLVLSAHDGFRLGARVDDVPGRADLVVLGNPTNPTSRLHPPEEVLRLQAPGRTLVVDEAFMDAVEPASEPRASLADRAATTPGLVVIRSLTKTFSIPGLRIGYLIGEPALVRALAQRQPHWSVGSLGCVAATACAGDTGQRSAAGMRQGLPKRLAHLGAGLQDRGLQVVDEPRGPFILTRHPRAAALREALRHKGFALRRGDTFPGLGPDWLRVSARDHATQDQLFGALDAVLHESTELR